METFFTIAGSRNFMPFTFEKHSVHQKDILFVFSYEYPQGEELCGDSCLKEMCFVSLSWKLPHPLVKKLKVMRNPVAGGEQAAGLFYDTCRQAIPCAF
jgi:hypothetical protein